MKGAGISKSAKEDWIRIDSNYLDRINLRKQLLRDFPTVCMGDSKISHPAIRELYEEVILDLLPKRYPSMFRISRDTFFNLVTGSRHYISVTLNDPRAMLRQLGENVEEDFYLMVPNNQRDFILGGCVACFPQGLHPASKVGLSVSQIHEPVPGYEGRLKKGVSRCFERLEPGQSVGRLNVRRLFSHLLYPSRIFTDWGQWAIQCNHGTLFLPYDGANTFKADDSPSQTNNVDPTSSFLRCEHHTLTCLPRTGTIVFAVRSYITPLTDIKSEGSGPLLAEACESMPEKFAVYKNRPTWGQTLCTWLKDDGTQSNDVNDESPSLTGSCLFSTKLASEGTCPMAP